MTQNTGRTFKMRVTPEWLAMLDELRRHEPDLPSRAALLRELVRKEIEERKEGGFW